MARNATGRTPSHHPRPQVLPSAPAISTGLICIRRPRLSNQRLRPVYHAGGATWASGGFLRLNPTDSPCLLRANRGKLGTLDKLDPFFGNQNETTNSIQNPNWMVHFRPNENWTTSFSTFALALGIFGRSKLINPNETIHFIKNPNWMIDFRVNKNWTTNFWTGENWTIKIDQ